MTSRQLAALLAVSGIWGASFLFIRVLINADVEPLGVSGGRLAIGAFVLAPFAWRSRRVFPRSPRTWAGLAALGAFNFALPWTLFAVAQQDIPSGVASIVNSSLPLWAAIFSVALIREEPLTTRRVVGLGLGFLGVLALLGDGLGDLGSASARGVGLCTLAVICYGVSVVSIRRWLKHVPALPLAFSQIAVAAVVLAPIALVSGAYRDASLGAKEWGSLLTLGAVGSGIAVVMYMWLVGQLGAVRASVVTYLMPPVGVFLGWLFLDESIGWNVIAGLAFVVAGVALVQGVPLQRWMRIFPRRPLTAPAGD